MHAAIYLWYTWCILRPFIAHLLGLGLTVAGRLPKDVAAVTADTVSSCIFWSSAGKSPEKRGPGSS